MELDRLLELLFAVGAGGIVVETIRAWRQRKKLGADYADVIASSAIKLLQPLEARVKEMERELVETKAALRGAKQELNFARTELGEARREIRSLTTKLRTYEEVGRNDGQSI